MTNIITKEDIKNNRSFILKWSKNPGDNGAYNPGWKQQTESDRFLELIENRPSIMNDAVFHKMEALEEDISYMQVDVELESMEVLTGDNTGAQLGDLSTITDTTPTFSRSVLRARGMTAKTYTTKTFLLANIEKESFLTHMESILAERAGYSSEKISIYGKRKAASRTKSGYDHIDGFLQQLYDVRDAYDDEQAPDASMPMGVMPVLDETKPLVPQLKSMITQFTKQKGNRSRAKIYVSSTVEGTLMTEADARETEQGDNLYFQGGQLYLWGVPIVHADVLDDLKNGFNKYDGQDLESAIDVQDIILMANPDSLVYGFLEEITSENDYLVEKKSYISTVDIFFDVLLLYNKDGLVAILPSPSN